MNLRKDKTLGVARDHLVSEQDFTIYWDNNHRISWTDIKDIKDLSPYYDSGDYDSHKAQAISFLDRIYRFVQRKMLLKKWKLIRQLCGNNTHVLDFGAGNGTFASYIQNQGNNVDAIEASEKARQILLQKKIRNYHSLEELEISKTYDVITLWHVLEHLPQPEDALHSLKNRLKPKGTLWIAVPNFESHDALHYKMNWAALDVPRHLWHFTEEGLLQMARNAGLKCVEKHPLYYDVFYISYLSEKHKKTRFPIVVGFCYALIFSIKAIVSKRHSSKIFVFQKRD